MKSQSARYCRQTILPGWGEKGQEKLKKSSVAVVGAGGLGSPALFYLAAAGVGSITIVDGGKVERTDLHRQILYKNSMAGKKKALCAASVLKSLNPEVEIKAVCEGLLPENSARLFSGCDAVLDCTDNFPARNLINETCFRLKIPQVYAAAYRFEGQLSVFNLKGGPCYRCLYPDTPGFQHGSSREAGIFGPAAGMMGTLQAAEAVKIILGLKTLAGRLFVFDALLGDAREFKLRKNPRCSVCGRRG